MNEHFISRLKREPSANNIAHICTYTHSLTHSHIADETKYFKHEDRDTG